MRLIAFLPLVLLCSLSAHAMEIDLRDRSPILIGGDSTNQELNILNDNPNYSLGLTYMSATAGCLDQSNETDIPIKAAFDPEDMAATYLPIPPGSAVSTGDLQLSGLPKCRNGVAVVIEVNGDLLDSNGDYVDWADSSIMFITY